MINWKKYPDELPAIGKMILLRYENLGNSLDLCQRANMEPITFHDGNGGLFINPTATHWVYVDDLFTEEGLNP